MVANHLVVVDGRVVGGWRRLRGKGAMIVETTLVARLDAAAREALRAAAARFQTFLGHAGDASGAAAGRMRAS